MFCGIVTEMSKFSFLRKVKYTRSTYKIFGYSTCTMYINGISMFRSILA